MPIISSFSSPYCSAVIASHLCKGQALVFILYIPCSGVFSVGCALGFLIVLPHPSSVLSLGICDLLSHFSVKALVIKLFNGV